MNRFDAGSKIAETPSSVIWGNRGTLAFAALLIACSITVGCSGDKPKQISTTSQIPMTAPQTVASSLPVPEVTKLAAKKVVRKRPATVTYSDKTYGVSFAYPRKYGIETGDAANELISSSPVPLNFVQTGGVALAAVELPETAFPNTDYSSAYFDVSIHQALSAEQCGEFSVPQTKVAPVSEAPAQPVSASTAPSTPSATAPSITSGQDASSTVVSSAPAVMSALEPQGSKLMLGDMELRGTEAVSGEGTRQNDAKYFHAFQNGACYEFALNVTTVAHEGMGMKHVDRDRVFDRLEKILATVKISPVAAASTPAIETTASIPATASAPETPAQ